MPLVKVADNWDALSDIEKIALFESASYEQSDIEDLRAIGKFRIVTYSKQNIKPSCLVEATPKPQIVLPKELLNIKQVEDINKITIIKNIANSTTSNKIQNVLLHFDDNCKDHYGTTWTANSGVSFVAGKFGNGVKLLNGTLTAEQNIDFGTNDFTIDFWQNGNPTQANPYASFFSSNRYDIRLETRRLTTGGGGRYDRNFSTPLTDGNWHHTAVVRKVGIFYVYQDGQLVMTEERAATESFNLKTIGYTEGSPSNTYFDGIIDEFHVVPYAKWTSNFTPPTEPYKLYTKQTLPNAISFAFTIDKNKYYIYNVGQWEEIQPDEIPTKGISAEVVESITKDKWHELITAKDTKVISKLGIAYSLTQRYTDDKVNIDNLSLTIEQKGKWRKAQPWSHYQVDYVDNETVEVTLNNQGSYKINYALGD